MITILIMLSLSLSEPNTLSSDLAWQILTQHWLEVKSIDAKPFDPNSQKHMFTLWPCDGNRDNYIVVRTKDPLDTLQVTSYHKNRMDYTDFSIFARQYRPVRPEPPQPKDPNLAEVLQGVTDPNLAAAIRELMTR